MLAQRIEQGGARVELERARVPFTSSETLTAGHRAGLAWGRWRGRIGGRRGHRRRGGSAGDQEVGA